jgi:AcrR family transcriptional regulator
MTSARDRILDAYERQIISAGERATTLESVAADAGVSKGGLLYHFASKDALRAALLARLEERSAISDEEATLDPAEAIRHSIESGADTNDPSFSAFLATETLARNGHRDAAEAIRTAERGWYDALLAATDDPLVARMAQLIGDGLYANVAIDPGPDASGFAVSPSADERAAIADALIELHDRRRA